MSSRWAMVRLGEVLKQNRDYIAAPEARVYPKLSVRLYGKGVVTDTPVDGARLKMSRHQIAKAGQVILSEIWGKKGAIGLVPSEGAGALCTSHFFLFDVQTQRVHPNWLQAIFLANYLQGQLDAEAKGTTGYAAVRPQTLLQCEIPLPPLEEQRRIVARIDNLVTRVGQARDLRRRAIQEAEALARSVAFALFEELGSCKQLRVEQVSEVRGGIQKSPARTPGANPVRYLTVAHVQRNRIITSDPRFFEVTPEEFQRRRLIAGDVLIIEGNGSADQIGRTALFRGEIQDCVHQNHVIRIRPDRTLVDPEYLNAYFNSPAGQDAVQARSRTTSGLRSLSVGRIKLIDVPVPDLEVQRHVVSSLGELQRQSDHLRLVQRESATELDALVPAILDKAFKGEM